MPSEAVLRRSDPAAYYTAQPINFAKPATSLALNPHDNPELKYQGTFLPKSTSTRAFGHAAGVSLPSHHPPSRPAATPKPGQPSQIRFNADRDPSTGHTREIHGVTFNVIGENYKKESQILGYSPSRQQQHPQPVSRNLGLGNYNKTNITNASGNSFQAAAAARKMHPNKETSKFQLKVPRGA